MKQNNRSEGSNTIHQHSDVINNNNTVIKNISKTNYLNLNFGEVIDIQTFINNYKNEYGLTSEQSRIILENYRDGGINTCISTLIHYLKISAIKQYKELKGKDIEKSSIILPFILYDKYLRDHFEKNKDGCWGKTTTTDNIKTLVGITDDYIYKFHNTYMYLTGNQKKKLINGLLKSSDYQSLSQLKDPELYKLDD
jgi:hypothetical protein